MDEFGVQSSVKWPNDVWIAGRKAAGILVESDTPGLYVAGIGVNLDIPDVVLDDLGLEHPATSLSTHTREVVSGGAFLTALRGTLEGYLSRLFQGDHADLIEELHERDTLSGRRLDVTTPGIRVLGAYEGVAPDGELILRTADGPVRIVSADSIRILPEV